MLKKINIFRAGKQVSSTGLGNTFTIKDLDGMVSSFNPESHEPPIRVGHEDNDKVPSFGWVKKLERIGEQLYAFVDFTDDMEDMIRKKHYRKVSASFYPPNSPSNPNKGKYTLRHVAMLGGQPPAVKGLEAFSFSEDEESMTLDLDLNFEESMEIEQLKEELEASFSEKLSVISDLQGKFSENKEVLEKIAEVATSVEELKLQFCEGDGEDVEEEALASFKEKLDALTEEKLQEFMEKKAEESEEETAPEEEEEEGFGEKMKEYEEKIRALEDFAEEQKATEAEDFTEKMKEYEEKIRVLEEFAEGQRVKDPETEAEDFTEKMKEYAEKIRALEEFAEAQKSKLEEAEAALLEEKRTNRRKEIKKEIEVLYSDGKITDGIYPQGDLFDYAVGLEEGSLDFSEGETPASTLLRILSKIPAPVDFSEVAGDGEAPEKEDEELDFAEQVEKLAQGQGISFEEALRIKANA